MLNDEFAFNKQRYNLTASIPISYICKKKEETRRKETRMKETAGRSPEWTSPVLSL